MRRYDIVTGILLSLSIVDFALAAPVLVQEEHQPRVDAVHVPKDVITVLEKRGFGKEFGGFGFGGGYEEKFYAKMDKSIKDIYPVSPAHEAPASASDQTSDSASSSTANSESSCVGDCYATTADWMKYFFSSDYIGGLSGPGISDLGGPTRYYHNGFPETEAPKPEGPWTHPSTDLGSLAGPSEPSVNHRPPPSLDAELHQGYQPLSAGPDSPPVDEAALYNLKGKAKVSEIQPARRSHE